MSQLIARLLLTVFLVPLTVLFASMVTVICYENLRYYYSFYGYRPFGLPRDLVVAIIAGLSSWAFFAVCWTAIWKRGVNWTPDRKRWTVLWPFASLLCAVIIGRLFARLDSEVGFFFFAASPHLIWVVGMVVIWRETDAERKARQQAAHTDVLTCPTCGYNLTGLVEARCPECGSRFTLNDLLSKQPSRMTEAMDREVAG